MKSINCIQILFLSFIFANNIVAQTPIDEATFKKDIAFLIDDAATGFQKSKGKLINNDYSYNYVNNYNIFGEGKGGLFYDKERYNKFDGTTQSETYYLFQKFDADKPDGAFVKANVERIFDELALTLGLKKKVEKYKKKDRDRIHSVEYLDKKGHSVLSFRDYYTDKSITLYIYSKLRPADLPNYLGCLVLYNMQSEKIVGAAVMYVYGKEIGSEAQLYSNVVSKIRQSYTLNYSKFAYYPNAKARDIEARLDPLKVTYSIENINPEGYTIK